MALRIAVVVEGKGEVDAVCPLLIRVWEDLLGRKEEWLDVLPPVRGAQGQMITREGLQNKIHQAHARLAARRDALERLILIMVDAERDGCPKTQAPEYLAWAREARSDVPIACVMPNPMFETWFVAAAGSLAGFNGLPADLTTPEDPEKHRHGKSWIRKHLPQTRAYRETADQKLFAGKINLAMCRENSESFDKLCRELECRGLPPAAPPPAADATP